MTVLYSSTAIYQSYKHLYILRIACPRSLGTLSSAITMHFMSSLAMKTSRTLFFLPICFTSFFISITRQTRNARFMTINILGWVSLSRSLLSLSLVSYLECIQLMVSLKSLSLITPRPLPFTENEAYFLNDLLFYFKLRKYQEVTAIQVCADYNTNKYDH